MPVVDTSFLIDAQRRPGSVDEAQRRLQATGEPLSVPVQVAIEFCAGLRDPSQGFREIAASYELVPCDLPIAREAATMAREAFAEGRFPGWGDIQVAATARWLGMMVVTREKAAFEALGVRAWDHTKGTLPA